jgi:hypothetical protein
MYFIKIKSLIFMKWTKIVKQFRFVISIKCLNSEIDVYISKQKDKNYKFIEYNLCSIFILF